MGKGLLKKIENNYDHWDIQKDKKDANHHLDESILIFHKTGNQQYLPWGYLTKAIYYRIVGEFQKAKKELQEAWEMAESFNMELFQIDCCLVQAQLYLDFAGRKKQPELREEAIEWMDEAEKRLEVIRYPLKRNQLDTLRQELGGY